MSNLDPVPLVEADLRLVGGLNERLFKLLAAVEQTGSINKAAKVVGLTYKGAWEMIERANNLSPKILVATLVGGAQGGGTQLTSAGKTFLNLFTDIQREHTDFLLKLNQRLSHNQEIAFLLKRLIMKASARNQFTGKVLEVTTGSVNVEVTVALKGGESIVATITKSSADDLGIKTGLDVIALIKAPQVLLISDFGGYKLSARNQLQGTVARIQAGSVNADVIIELAGGDSIAATITHDSIENLGLKVGCTATAVFKSGAVILGVAA